MRSIWKIDDNEQVCYPQLTGVMTVDTVIIGGGITGVTTALRLVEDGQLVAVLEAGRVGSGDTGNSTGNLYSTVSQGLAPIEKKWDQTVVSEVVSARAHAVDFIEKTVDRYGIDCQFSRRPLHFCVRDASGAQQKALDKMLDSELEVSLAAGLSASIVNQIAEFPLAVHRALRIENQAQFNPFKYTRGVAKTIAEQGGLIFSNSRLVSIDADIGLVKTANGEIKAKNIVFATHTPLGINLLQAEMQPYREYGISARLNGNSYPEGVFWMQDDSKSVRSYDYKGEKYLVVVGSKHKTGEGTEGPGYYKTLQEYASRHFDVASFEHQWSAQQFQSADLLPYIGRSGHDNVWVGTGYSADGLTWGTLAGGVISDQIKGRENRVSDLFNPRRFTPIKSAAGWLKENASVTKHFVKDYLTPAKLKHLEEVMPGEGKLVKLDGEKLAVYRSPDNELSVLSPVCPHMKCLVSWNDADTTWDCPCHGSRFSPTDGSVIEGPAIEPLTRHTPAG